MKKIKPTKREVDLVRKDLLARITAAEFDKSGLRIHQAPFARDEFDFSWVQPWEAEDVARYEYQRELKRYYDSHRLFLNEDFSAMKKKQSVLVDSWHLQTLFPLPYGEFARLFSEDDRRTIVERIGAFHEVDHEWTDRLTRENPDLSFHHLRIDWSRGRDAIKRDFAKWLDESGKDRKTIQRRPKEKVISERLDQLAAYRAHCAGLNQSSFAALKPRISYGDASAFRKGWKKAEVILKSFLKA